MEKLSREAVKSLRVHLQVALDNLNKLIQDGQFKDLPKVNITVGGASYSESNATFKVEVALVGTDGEVKSKTAEDFKTFAVLFGLDPDVLGKTFKNGGHTFKICGLKGRSVKYPVLAEREDGKKFKFGADFIKLVSSQIQK